MLSGLRAVLSVLAHHRFDLAPVVAEVIAIKGISPTWDLGQCFGRPDIPAKIKSLDLDAVLGGNRFGPLAVFAECVGLADGLATKHFAEAALDRVHGSGSGCVRCGVQRMKHILSMGLLCVNGFMCQKCE